MPWATTNPEGNLAQFGNIALHGGDVGGLAAALAALRYKQIKDAQDAVVAAGEGIGKEMDKQQAEKAIAASIATGQNAGLIPQGDYGTGPEAGVFAKTLAQQMELSRLRSMQEQLDKNHQGLYDAQAAQANAMAHWINQDKPLAGPAANSSATGFDPTNPFRTDPVTGMVSVGRMSPRGVVNWFPIATGLQPTTARTSAPPAQENLDAIIKGYGLTRSDFLDSTHQYGLVNGQSLPAGQPWDAATHIRIKPADATKPSPDIPIDVFNSIKNQIISGQRTPPNSATGAPVNTGDHPDVIQNGVTFHWDGTKYSAAP